VSVHLVQRGQTLHIEVTGSEDEPVLLRQLCRMLGLDADTSAWEALGERDPVMGALQREFVGFYTAAFPSPYEAAVGGVLAQRTSMRQASGLRRKLSEAHGAQIHGLRTLPRPQELLQLKELAGLPAHKIESLRSIARAALLGELDAELLRSLPQQEALDRLRCLPGVGPWTAEHVLLRGAAPPDGTPSTEPRVQRALQLLYGRPLSAPPASWRPFRMWGCVLAVRHLAAAGLFNAGRAGERARGRAPSPR
jgi:DNA-3-methyladenine glycosylase II